MIEPRVRVLAITKEGFATIYTTERGVHYTYDEFLAKMMLPHNEKYKMRTLDIDKDDPCNGYGFDGDYQYQWLCSKVSNYDFEPGDFNLLWHYADFLFEEEITNG